MLKIGLTGGIASGKTLVSDTLGDAGAGIIDTDVIAREIVAPGSDGLNDIRSTFGERFIDDDGALDRTAMREHVFANPDARRQLEQITHPRIGAQVVTAIADANTPYVVIVVPLLTGSRLRSLIDRTLVIDCDPAIQMQRLIARDGIDAPLAFSMLAAQASREERLAIADDILDNQGERRSIVERARRLHTFYLTLSE